MLLIYDATFFQFNTISKKYEHTQAFDCQEDLNMT